MLNITRLIIVISLYVFLYNFGNKPLHYNSSKLLANYLLASNYGQSLLVNNDIMYRVELPCPPCDRCTPCVPCPPCIKGVAYYSKNTSSLYYNDVFLGQIDLGSDNIKPIALELIDNRPAMTYYDNTFIKYIIANDKNGYQWSNPINIFKVDTDSKIVLNLIRDNKPIISICFYGEGKIKVVKSLDGTGTQWDTNNIVNQPGACIY